MTRDKLDVEPVRRASYLRILVVVCGEERVRLRLPSRALGVLEDLMPASARNALANSGQDLCDIRRRVELSGAVPQVLFEINGGDKIVKVWLD